MFSFGQILKRSPILTAAVVACFVHAALFLLPIAFFSETESSPIPPVVVEHWDAPNEVTKSRKLVPTEEALEQVEDDKPADFVSDKRNRVKEETIAPNEGPFRHSNQASNTEQDPSGEGNLNLGDLLPYGSQGVIGEDEGFELGAQTILNTDAVQYSSFFLRLQDRVFGPWRSAAQKAYQLLPKKPPENHYVTKLLIEMDLSGNIVSIRTLKRSGYVEFDNAAKHAFWEAEPFENPPVQLAEGKQTFSFPFSFTHVVTGSNHFFDVRPFRL